MSSAESAPLPAPPSLVSAPSATPGDALYYYNEATVEAARDAKPWMQDGKYLLRASISPTAAMKMLSHAQSGVDKGIAKSGKPIEIMGLLIGRPGTEEEGDARRIVIVDAQPLPIEGMETRVVADDDDVINYMISVGEAVEMSRKERICGWYHSHPFDLGAHSNCFMSNTDVTTQLQWQRNEDRHGNPWLAIVIDPLRTIAKGSPDMKAFRVYPPEYTAPENETPDGTIERDNTRRMELWGGCWNRYYELELQYHASSLTSTMLSIMRTNTMWMETLAADTTRSEDSMVAENERLAEAVRLLQGQGQGAARPGASRAAKIISELALHRCVECMATHTKKQLFATPCATTGQNHIATPFPGADAFIALASSDVIPPPPQPAQATAVASATASSASASASAGSSIMADAKVVMSAVGSLMEFN